jgi:hypothetical protein
VSVLEEVQREADPALAEHAVSGPGPGRFDAELPARDRAFVVEAVREGFELHYGEPRAFTGMDADLQLLAGDSLYALGLARLADRGDLDAVAELADLITLSAQAEAEGRPGDTDALWARSVERLAQGAD